MSGSLVSTAAAALACVCVCATPYSRPSQASKLRVWQVVPPLLRGQWSHRNRRASSTLRSLEGRARTNQWDDVRARDLKDHLFFEPVLRRLITGSSEEQKVFPLGYEGWRRAYKDAGLRLGF